MSITLDRGGALEGGHSDKLGREHATGSVS